MSKGISKEPSLERAAFRSKGLKEGEDDVRVFFKDPYNVRGKDRLLCFVSEHTVCSENTCKTVRAVLTFPEQRYPFVVVYNDAKWNLEKRFSDFAQLDSELDDHFKSNESVQLPEFPPKKLFGSLSPALITERKEKLEKYMKALAKDPVVIQCQCLRAFLETPDVVGADKHKEFDFGRR